MEPAPSNLLTPSRLSTYLKCGQLHSYLYYQGYVPVEVPEHFRFGRLWHLVMEAALRAIMETLSPGDVRAYELFGRVAIEAIPRGTDPYEAAKIRAHVRGVRVALEGMQFFHTHRILFVEKAFVFPHMNPATGRASPNWLRAGKIDAIFEHMPTKRIRVMEHKTTSESIDLDSTYWLKLAMDCQISQYVLGTEMMNPGMTVDEVIYDVVCKTGFRPLMATPIESRKFTMKKFKQCPGCKKKDPAPHLGEFGACTDDPEGGPRIICTDPGGKPYSGQRVTDETPAEYEERIWNEGILPNPSAHFRLQLVPRTEAQILQHLRDTWIISQSMNADRSSGWAVRNTNACHQYGTCPFWGVCTGTASLDDASRFRRLEHVHPELDPEEIAEAARSVGIKR